MTVNIIYIPRGWLGARLPHAAFHAGVRQITPICASLSQNRLDGSISILAGTFGSIRTRSMVP
jgi:hypothetical protein